MQNLYDDTCINNTNLSLDNIKILRRFDINDEWSINTVTFHHKIAVKLAYENIVNKNSKLLSTNIYNFQYLDIKYKLIPISLKDEIVFLQLKEDNTISFLKLLQKRYIKQEANNDINTIYLTHPLRIKKGDNYYYDNKLKKIVIGWHGSYKEPYDMAGMNIVSQDEWF